jgi:hypothetical protein
MTEWRREQRPVQRIERLELEFLTLPDVVRAFPARRRIVEYVERVTAAEKLAPTARIFLNIALTRGGDRQRTPPVPIVQPRIAPSGVATIAVPNSGAIVSTSLLRRNICSTLVKCRWRYGFVLGTYAII